jgi:hypothetical protein
MPEYMVMKVTVEVEIEIRGPDDYGDAVTRALGQLDLRGARVKSVHVHRDT